MIHEIERKFLLKNIRLIDELKADGIELRSTREVKIYSKISTQETIYYLNSETKFFKIVQTPNANAKQISVSKSEFTDAQSLRGILYKTKYSFSFNNLPCFLYVFSGSLEGICILRVEFMRIEDAAKFILPPFLADFSSGEITKNNDFSDANLVLFGNPNFNFSYQSALKFIAASGINSIFMPGFLSAYDAIRLALFEIHIRAKASLFDFLQNKTTKSLDNLVDTLWQILSILRDFSGVFDEKTIQKFQSEFTLLQAHAKKLRDENYFGDFLGVNLRVAKDYTRSRQILEDESILIFSSEDTNRTFKEWEIILSDEDDFYSSAFGQKHAKIVIAREFRKNTLKAAKSIFKIANATKALNSLKEFELLYSKFGENFALNSGKKFEKKLYKMLENLELSAKYKFLAENLDGEQKSQFTSKFQNIMQKADEKSPVIIKKLRKISAHFKAYYSKEN